MKAKRKQDLAHARELLRTAYKLLSDVADKERDDFNRMDEKYQFSTRGERREEDIFTLENIRDGWKQDIEQIQEIIGGIV